MYKKLLALLEETLYEYKSEILEELSIELAFIFLRENFGVHQFKTVRDFLIYTPTLSWSNRTIEDDYGWFLRNLIQKRIIQIGLDNAMKTLNRNDIFNYFTQKNDKLDKRKGNRSEKLIDNYHFLLQKQISEYSSAFYKEMKNEPFYAFLTPGLNSDKNKEIWEKEKLRRLVN